MSIDRRPAALALLLLLAGTAASARDDSAAAPAFRLSGDAGLVSDYRFRGVSRSDTDIAALAGLTLEHRSGAYARVRAATVAGWGSAGGADVTIDLVAGFTAALAGGNLDIGVTGTLFPGAPDSGFVEPFATLSGTLGPVSLLGGVAWAPPQTALGNVSNHPDSRPRAAGDNFYAWADALAGLPGTPITVKVRLGHSSGNPGLGPGGTSLAPTGAYWDWLLGADLVIGAVTVGIAYVDTDIGRRDTAVARLQPGFARRGDGAPIAAGTLLVSLTAGF